MLEKEIKEKIQLINPNLTDELLDLLCELVIYKLNYSFEEMITKYYKR